MRETADWKEMAFKWYRLLDFPKECDDEFKRFMRDKDLASVDPKNPVQYLVSQKDLGLNLLYFLYKCEDMKAAYDRRGIPERFFWASAKGILEEALYCKEVLDQLGIYEVAWMQYVVGGEILFRIGRLNFLVEIAGEWCEGEDVYVGDKIVTVHIPGGEKLDYDACCESFAEAEGFLAQYFPEHDFKYFICDSWLLYEGYIPFLGEGSNVSKFQTFFVPYRTEESDIAIKFAFAKNVTRENLIGYSAKNSFQKKFKQYILEKGKLYVTFGKRRNTKWSGN